MKDEIKEILDYLGNDKNYNCDCNDGSYYLELPYREAHELKDCITNLQEENERLSVELNKNMIERNNYLSRNEKAIEKLESIRTFGLRIGKTLFSTLINESIDILNGDDNE